MTDPVGTVYLVDTHALIYQMFHAVAPMSAPDGRPTNALFGVTRDLLYLWTDVQPTYLACAFDLPGPTFRSDIAADYKAHRPPPPDDLAVQVPMIKQVVEAMNLPVLALPGYEADDVMATVAAAGSARGYEVTICASDKDCRQLIGDRVRMYNLRKRTTLDAKFLFDDWGVTPEQVVDFQTLVGDPVDNVPGVPGVGEKTAAKLLQQYGTLDNLLARVEEIKQPKLKANLKEAAASGRIETSRKLVRLDVNVPMALDWDAWKRRPWDSGRLAALFAEFGFRRFAEQARAAGKVIGARKNADLLAAAGLTPRQLDLFDAPPTEEVVRAAEEQAGEPDFAFGANAPPDAWQADYRLVDTPEKWADFVAELRQQPRIAFDLETTGLDALACDIVGFAFSWQERVGYYVPVRARRPTPSSISARSLPT